MNANDRSIVGLVTVAHGMVHTYEMSIPILVTIWLSEFGVTEALLGAVVTVGYGLFGVGALPGGILSDRFGSRRLIVACLLGMAASFAMLGITGALPLPTAAPLDVPIEVWLIALSLLLWGTAASVYHPAGLSLISTGARERGRAFAYHGMGGNVGIALGPLTTILLLEVLDWRTAVVALSVPAALAAAFAVRVEVDERAAIATTDGGSEEPPDREGRASVDSLEEFVAGSRRLFAGAFVVVFVITICSGLVYRGALTFLPEILADLSLFRTVEIGDRELEAARYAYVGILMIGVFGQYLGGRLSDRIRPEAGLAVAFAVLAALVLGFLPASRVGGIPLLVAAGLLGVALFVAQPLYQAAVAEYTPANARGVSYGYTYLGVFGVGAFGGALAGWLLTYASVAALFWTLAGIALFASVLGTGLTRGWFPIPSRPARED